MYVKRRNTDFEYQVYNLINKLQTFKTLHLILLINYMVLNNFFPHFQNKLHLLFSKIFFSNHEVALYVLQIIENNVRN